MTKVQIKIKRVPNTMVEVNHEEDQKYHNNQIMNISLIRDSPNSMNGRNYPKFSYTNEMNKYILDKQLEDYFKN